MIELDSRIVPISSAASELVARSVGKTVRVLILGAGGWFGRTFVSLLANTGCTMLLIGSSSRTIWVNGAPHGVASWNEQTVADFAPNIVLDFAYLTPRYINDFGPGEYLRKNRELCKKVLWLSSLESVSRLITVSSGAIYERATLGLAPAGRHLYGQLKRDFEEELSVSSQRDGTGIVIARAFSVSGGFVRFPQEYAVSAFVLQALESRSIVVESRSFVYRRYCSVDDLLAVAMGLSSDSGIVQFDSGGDLVEMSRLAEMVGDAMDQNITVRAPARRELGHSERYHSDNFDWQEALRLTGHKPLGLREQIAGVVAAFSPHAR